MGDGDDGIDWERVGRVATEPDGSFHWGRIRSAVRGRGSRDHGDLTPLFVLAVLWTICSPVFAMVTLGPRQIGPHQLAGAGVVVLFLLTVWVADRLDEYDTTDDDVVIEELRARYAAGALSLEEFEARVARVIDEGPEAVDPSIDPDGESAAGDRDPVSILQERYARGEIDDAEYRRRLDVLGEDESERVATE